MSKDGLVKVGKNIFTILSESLYSNPAHLFREYIQNSIDSIERNKELENPIANGLIEIYLLDNNGKIIMDLDLSDDQPKHLVFKDNGMGLKKGVDIDTLAYTLAISGKAKSSSIGYKGIGRLSGYSYCDTITFINHYSDRSDSLLLNAKMIRENAFEKEEEEKDFSIFDYVEINKNYPFLQKFKGSYGFYVVLSNINASLLSYLYTTSKKETTTDMVVKELEKMVRCRMSDELVSVNDDVIRFYNDYNNSINYEIQFNGVTVQRKYSVENNIEREYFQTIYSDKHDVIAKVIYNVGKEYSITYRKNNKLRKGIRLYYKGMLVSEDYNFVSSLHNTIILSKSLNSYNQGTQALYTEVHIMSNDVYLNSARNWISSVVPDNADATHTSSLFDFFVALMEDMNKVRYEYSYFSRENKDLKQHSELYKTFEKSFLAMISDYNSSEESRSEFYVDYFKKSFDNGEKPISDHLDNYLFSKKLNYIFSYPKTEAMFNELCDLNINQYRYACAISFRSFCELAMKHYEKKSKNVSLSDQDLVTNILKCSNYIFIMSKDKPTREDKNLHSNITTILKEKGLVKYLNSVTHDLETLVNTVQILQFRTHMLPLFERIFK